MRYDLQRVAVVGSSCSGKSTFARSLAGVLQHPYIELDAIHWQPGWVARSKPEFRNLVEAAARQEFWVMDGNYATARDLIWSRATAVIWLNYSFPVVMWRGLTRTIRRSLTQEELFSSNRESFRQSFFSRDSILWWIITTFHKRRKRYRALFSAGSFPNLSYIEFRKPAEAERFLAGLKAGNITCA